MHAILPSVALAVAVAMLLGGSGCQRQSLAERRADLSREEPPGTVDIGVPRRIADSPPPE